MFISVRQGKGKTKTKEGGRNTLSRRNKFSSNRPDVTNERGDHGHQQDDDERGPATASSVGSMNGRLFVT